MDEALQKFGSQLRGSQMPELRKDPIVGRWVIIATDRAKRPIGPHVDMPPPAGGYCPFCEGSENNTPFEILAYREPQYSPQRKRLAHARRAQ